ncbi:MAG: hypothetical protein L0Y72_24875 [Gemmataceae bacterium]|nr:hypothetical protein [Gemmataceae bacterium]MCI0742279.1 hypothetical protein [Gemmataceae bacterium]
MRHPSGNVARQLRFVPVRVLAAQRFPHHVLGKCPKPKCNRQPFGRGLPPQDRCHRIVYDINGRIHHATKEVLRHYGLYATTPAAEIRTVQNVA